MLIIYNFNLGTRVLEANKTTVSRNKFMGISVYYFFQKHYDLTPMLRLPSLSTTKAVAPQYSSWKCSRRQLPFPLI